MVSGHVIWELMSSVAALYQLFFLTPSLFELQHKLMEKRRYVTARPTAKRSTDCSLSPLACHQVVNAVAPRAE